MIFLNFVGWGNSLGAVANVLDCDIIVSEFELQSQMNTFRRDINQLIPIRAMWGRGRYILPLQTFYIDGFSIQ